MAFAWPRPGKNPYVFDFATSAVARGEIELHRRTGRNIRLGWAVDEAGAADNGCIGRHAEGAILIFGGHKGSALSTMVELLTGPLLGDLTSLESQKFDHGVGATPCHGELIIALLHSTSTSSLREDARKENAHAEAMFDAIVGQGARLPSQRRFDARARSEANGVEIGAQLYADVCALTRN